MNALIATLAAVAAVVGGLAWLARRLPPLEFPEGKLHRLGRECATADVAAIDAVVEHLRAGGAGVDQLTQMLAAWRDDARGGGR